MEAVASSTSGETQNNLTNLNSKQSPRATKTTP